MNPQANPFPKRPFRFGVQLKTAPTGADWDEQARRIESHGYDIATMPDHFHDQFAPVPALQAVLAATTTPLVSEAMVPFKRVTFSPEPSTSTKACITSESVPSS